MSFSAKAHAVATRCTLPRCPVALLHVLAGCRQLPACHNGWQHLDALHTISNNLKLNKPKHKHTVQGMGRRECGRQCWQRLNITCDYACPYSLHCPPPLSLLCLLSTAPSSTSFPAVLALPLPLPMPSSTPAPSPNAPATCNCNTLSVCVCVCLLEWCIY